MKLRIVAVVVSLVAALGLTGCEKQARPGVDVAKSADGVSINYETAGKGEPALVFVHCWTCNRGLWDRQVEHFSQQYQVVQLDLAGHGESGKGRKEYTMAAFGADVAAVVNKVGAKQVVLIGHSMGGPAVLEAEKLLGDKVLGVVGVDTFYTNFKMPTDAKERQEFTEKFLKQFETNFPDAVTKFMRSLFAPTADPMLVELVSQSSASADKNMALSAMQNIFVWYGNDAEASFQRVGKRLRNINGDAKGGSKPLHDSVVLIAGAAHFPAQEKPAEFNQALDTIVKQFIDPPKVAEPAKKPAAKN
ncbi:MAG TPA: alpha/beta hydrolase [Burkholderiales bacterium]|nr:alpha/beta hydrolase [Burkholderiales bacterium]